MHGTKLVLRIVGTWWRVLYIAAVALYLGVKMFIIEYLYNRFPRLKQHHDSVYRIWQQLPTDAVLEDQYKRSLVDRVCFRLCWLRHLEKALLDGWAWQNHRRKNIWQFHTCPFRLPLGDGEGGNMGAHVPKAQGLKRHGRGLRPCNTEGTRGVWQTDRQTDRLSSHYSKIVKIVIVVIASAEVKR